MIERNGLGRQIGGDRARHAPFYLVRHPDRGAELAGSAIAALKAIMLNEGILERMQMVGLSKTFDRGDRTTLILYRQREARVDPFTVD